MDMLNCVLLWGVSTTHWVANCLKHNSARILFPKKGRLKRLSGLEAAHIYCTIEMGSAHKSSIFFVSHLFWKQNYTRIVFQMIHNFMPELCFRWSITYYALLYNCSLIITPEKLNHKKNITDFRSDISLVSTLSMKNLSWHLSWLWHSRPRALYRPPAPCEV